MHRCLFVALAVLTCSTPTAFAAEPDPRTVVRYGPAYKYPQDGWTVLHIEGEPYDRGYQHGHLMAKEIAGYLHSLSAQQSSTSPADGWKLTRTLVSANFLRKIGTEYLEEMKGTADGAAANGAAIHGRPVDLLDLVCANCSAEYDTLDGALNALPTGLEGKQWPKKIAAESDAQADAGSLLSLRRNRSRDERRQDCVWSYHHVEPVFHEFYNVWLDVKPVKGHRVLMQSFPGGIWSGMDYYLASSGLMLTETTIRQTRLNPDGIPLADRARRAMQYGNSIDDVVKTLVEKNNGLYANDWLIGDANTNEIATLELGTNAHRLRRSSKNEWINGGMHGFYWGCNNTKDLQVRLDTYASLTERPHDVSWRPSDRDQAWLKLLKEQHGKIDANFGKIAFTTPPLAAHSSLDAKYTTTDMVKELKTVALFGPPLGLAWRPTFEQRTKYPDIKTLISNDWTTLVATRRKTNGTTVDAVDLNGKANAEGTGVEADGDDDEGGVPNTNPAWRGTLLPKSDADLWLTTGFAQYERIFALELALKEKREWQTLEVGEGSIGPALFRYRSDYRNAMVTRPGKEPGTPTEIEIDRARWHKMKVAYGVLTFEALRKFLGDSPFVDAMVAYGQKNAGRDVTVADFTSFVGKATNKDVVSFFRKWEDGAMDLAKETNPFHVQSFFEDLPHTLIVYGTTVDTAANNEAAMELQRMIREKWSNMTVPVVADREVTKTQAQNNHLLFIGKAHVPMNGGNVAELFGPRSFNANGTVYGHPGSALLLAGVNTSNPRYSYVLMVGNSAESTWHAPAKLMNAPIADMVVFPANGGMKAMIRK